MIFEIDAHRINKVHLSRESARATHFDVLLQYGTQHRFRTKRPQAVKLYAERK